MNEVQRMIHQKVCELRKTHKKSEYFDRIDAYLQTNDIRYGLKGLIINSNYVYSDVIMSGGFGLYCFNAGKLLEISFLVPGGLRKTLKCDSLTKVRNFIEGQELIFIDDSFFGGRTRDAIKHHIADLGGKLIHTFVAYDGAREKDPNVTALYRYFDHFED